MLPELQLLKHSKVDKQMVSMFGGANSPLPAL